MTDSARARFVEGVEGGREGRARGAGEGGRGKEGWVLVGARRAGRRGGRNARVGWGEAEDAGGCLGAFPAAGVVFGSGGSGRAGMRTGAGAGRPWPPVRPR